MDGEHQPLFRHPLQWKIEVADGVEDRLLDSFENLGELPEEIDRPADLAPGAVAGMPSSDPPHPNALPLERGVKIPRVEPNPSRRLIPEGDIQRNRRGRSG